MARYSEEFKESITQKMMPPNNVPVSQLVRDTGISDVTLYTWRKKALFQGIPVLQAYCLRWLIELIRDQVLFRVASF
ncbi:transposase [Endozoicomonas sp. YOMI1]|uniref:transposase n=1 Tax=Endozoicomonas sp. YOMI1 TaxID=2828739 RepID=UPI00359F4146